MSTKKKGGCGNLFLTAIIISVAVNIIDGKEDRNYDNYESSSTSYEASYVEDDYSNEVDWEDVTVSVPIGNESEILTNYANQFSYLAGTAGYNGYFVKQEYQHIYTCAESIPMTPITCLQLDFDYDGVEELLIASPSENDTINLYMYEAIDGSAQCTSSIALPVPVAASGENGLVDGIYYEQNGRIMISFYEKSSFGYLGDAHFIRFAAAYYDGTQFQYMGFAETIGSAGEDPDFENQMAFMGLYVDLGALVRGETGIRDYMTNPLTFSECATYCTWTMEDWIAYSDTWYHDDSITSVQASVIEFR